MPQNPRAGPRGDWESHSQPPFPAPIPTFPTLIPGFPVLILPFPACISSSHSHISSSHSQPSFPHSRLPFSHSQLPFPSVPPRFLGNAAMERPGSLGMERLAPAPAPSGSPWERRDPAWKKPRDRSGFHSRAGSEEFQRLPPRARLPSRIPPGFTWQRLLCPRVRDLGSSPAERSAASPGDSRRKGGASRGRSGRIPEGKAALLAQFLAAFLAEFPAGAAGPGWFWQQRS